MKHLYQFSIMLFLLVMSTIFSSHASDMVYEPFGGSIVTPMQSVNTMSGTGSTYSSSVYEVEAESPLSFKSVRKGGPSGGGGTSTYDPNNPQFAPIGDATIWMILLALGAGWIQVRKKNRQSQHA